MTDYGSNAMLPYAGRLAAVRDIADEIKLFTVAMENGGWEAFQEHRPGQFAFLSAYGVGEAPFGIASISSQEGELEFAVQRLGCVTTALHELGVGDRVGVRGPLGNCFPMHEFEGKDIIVLGGGIGGAPLRPVINSILTDRERYGHLRILWAARNPSLMIFTEEFEQWRSAPETDLHLTVDEADEGWGHDVGLITELLDSISPSAQDTVAITCGPPIMIYFVAKSLAELGFKPSQGYVTLEARMHCGIGKCGRCNLGEQLICVDGPVFSMAEVGHMLEGYL
ncbi:MAG: FAD/NAD(P)-binding protein [Anaerolineales bacterium]|jgi:NAD(P)H-flavin reductase